VQYWGLLAELALDTAKIMFSRSFDVARADGLSRGLRDFHRSHLHRTPGALRRLRQVPRRCAELVRHHDVVISPVVARTAPPLGELSPTVAFDELIHRLTHWVAYTPLQNISGQPAISVPTGLDATGLPTAVMMSAAHGDERTLLELAFLLEAEQPFPSIQG
jgi:amidase